MKHLDLVVDGGGFSGSHLVGALAYLKHLRDNQLVHIRRVAGVSVGAISALLFQADMLNHAFHMYPSIRTHYAKHLNTAIVSDHLATILTHLDTHLPAFFRTCNLHISYFHVPSMKHITVSHFTSNTHLLDIVRRSVHMPLFYDGSTLLRGKYIDGLYPDTFLFSHVDGCDGSGSDAYQTLFFNLTNLPLISMVSTQHRPSIHDSALEGTLLTHQFFRSGQNNHFCHIFTHLSCRGAIFLLCRVVAPHILLRILIATYRAWVWLGEGSGYRSGGRSGGRSGSNGFRSMEKHLKRLAKECARTYLT
jgi:hypothetical protein